MPTTLTPAGPASLGLTLYPPQRLTPSGSSSLGLAAVGPMPTSAPGPGTTGTGFYLYTDVGTITPAASYQTGLIATLGLAGLDSVMEVDAPADPAPAGVTEALLQRVSEVYPAPTVVDGQVQQPWVPSSTTRGDVGVLHVFVAGSDRTYVRGARTQVQDYALMDPFGCGPAHLRFPRVTALDTLGSGDLAWLRPGVRVDIDLVAPGGTRTNLWAGVLTGEAGDGASSGGQGTLMEAVGDFSAGAGLQMHKPRQYVPTTDRGTLIARACNEEVLSRHISALPTVATGSLTRERGSSDQAVQEYVQSILPSGWTIARTSSRRVYRLQTRGTGGRTWTVRALQRGVDADLRQDWTQAPNIIYGRGVNGDGYAWANWRYPGQDGTSQPPYPMASAGTVMTIGTSDADTTTGSGVSDLQERINELNITADVAVTGTYDSVTAAAIRGIQSDAGISVDGVTAGQTWNALWPLYTSDQLDDAVRLPLAGDNRVQPWLYAADGTITGKNPGFRSDLLRVERDENMGSGISKALGIQSASQEYLRTRSGGEAHPGLVGSVRLAVDPNEGSRFLIREGDKLRVQGWRGGNPLLHIGGVSVSPEDGAGSVSLTVDELARDLPTIAAIRAQDEQSRDDPLRMPGRRARRSQTTPDEVEPFDGESRAGIIPRIPLFAGLWTVQAIPLSAAGKIARITLRTTPVCAFYVALFGDRVTAAQLIRYVGDPTDTDEYGRGPYQPNQDKLAELGFIDAVGGPLQPAGFSPGQATSPWNGDSSPLTGKLDSQAPISYRSTRPPWIWVAFYASASCYVSGRILPGPIEG